MENNNHTHPAYAGQITTVPAEINGATLILEHGRFAEQATASVFATLGGTQVLAIVTLGPEKDLDYFPLSVEYQERLYAGGKIKGSRWVKREGRPSDDAILAGRLIDRSCRPLFPKGIKNEVQVVIEVLSVDGLHDPVVLAANAVFAALAISPIPWNGPLGTVRVGLVDDKLMAHPENGQRDASVLDLVVSSSNQKIVMIEAGANQVPEERMMEAMNLAHQNAQKIINAINELTAKVGQTKLKVLDIQPDQNLVEEVDRMVREYVKTHLADKKSIDFDDAYPLAKEQFGLTYDEKVLKPIFEKIWKKAIRAQIVTGVRTDGRKLDELRSIGADVGLLARTHGSGVFRRGSTHVLSITALGTPEFSQIIESASAEETKRFIHYYSMPPFASGETGRIGSPGRREVGHGALAEKALEPVIPSEEEFPYTIMVVSEVMSSNGSTSMGSTCGTTLSLMDAGVPLKAPVSGIAMGLISDAPNGPMILTDIAGIEDYNGDMDFKVAGTETGITAIQLDIKFDGLELPLVVEVLKRARTARLEILKTMLAAIPSPRPQVSPFAPKVEIVKIATDQIGEVIGPGGRMIRRIVAETGAEVNVDDDGKVTISGTDIEAVKKAVAWVKGLTTDPEVGKIYSGTVKRIVPFGAFVEILPGKEGLVHVSRMAQGFVDDPHSVVTEDQPVQVKLFEIDEMGRLNLTMLLDDQGPSEGEMPPSDGYRSYGGGGDRGNRDHGRGGRGGDRRDFRRGR